MTISRAGDQEMILGNQIDPKRLNKQLDDFDEIRMVPMSLS